MPDPTAGGEHAMPRPADIPPGVISMSHVSQASWADLEAQNGTRWIAHRGGGRLAPENSGEALRLASELGADAAEFDAYVVTDGGLVVMHDGTANRTTNLSGSQASAWTSATALRGRINAGSWFANTWPSDLRIPMLADVLADVGNRLPLICHANNTGSGAAAIEEIQRQELDDAVLLMAWTEAELGAARNAGVRTCLLDADGSLPSGQSYAGLLAVGTTYLGLDFTQASTATIQAAAAAGLKVLMYTVNTREDYAELPTDGSVWGVISDDPWYVRGTAPLRTRDLFSAGTFTHGMAGIPDLGDYRGAFTPGTPFWWGLDGLRADVAANDGYTSSCHGYLGPLPTEVTIDSDLVIDAAASSSASAQLTLLIGDRPYDDYPSGSSPAANGYNVLVRSSGVIDVYRISAGMPTKIGTATTAPITAGTVHHLRVQVTPTQIIVTRTNITAPNTLSVTDSVHRGGMYPHLGVRHATARWSGLAVT